jgi:diguanylate cyclase (GGDEF)-like protein
MIRMGRRRHSDLTETMPISVGKEEGADDPKREKIPLLLVIAGERVGTRCRLGAPVTVGRDPSVDLPLRDAGISWRHARFEHGPGGGIGVSDLGSTNGTFVNEKRVEQAALVNGDKIRVGSTVLKLELVDSIEEGFHSALDRMLNTDDLRFEMEASLLIEAAVSQGKRLSLLLMDLDGLKAINDLHGHHFGAYTIAEAGKLIGRVVAARGIVTRFGGDEFAALLPETDEPAAVEAAQEVRLAIAAHSFEIEGLVLRITLSIGVASLPEGGVSLEELTRRADSALYRAKAAGKDRVAT